MSRNLPAEMPVSLFPVSASLQIVQTLGGLACAGLILIVLAFLRAPRESGPATEIYTAHLVTLPFDEPPPPPREQAPPEPGPIVGPMRLEIAPEVSAVHLQVPDFPLLDTEMPRPPARAVVAARFELAKSIPRPVDVDDLSVQRIFSRNEVDQRPMVVYRATPKLSDQKVSQMATPRVVLLMVVDTGGSVGEVRVMHGSGDEDFDRTVIESVREWRFSPAIRKGRKVRCWAEEAVSVKVSDATPFEAR